MNSREEKNHGTLGLGFCEGESYPTSLLEFSECADGQKDRVEPAELGVSKSL